MPPDQKESQRLSIFDFSTPVIIKIPFSTYRDGVSWTLLRMH